MNKIIYIIKKSLKILFMILAIGLVVGVLGFGYIAFINN
jgi:hypothetical protein